MGMFVKAGVVLAFLIAGILVFSMPKVSASASPADISAAASESSPRSLYVSNCARCHGSNGKAQTREGRRLEADDLTSGDVKGISESKMRRVITNGRGKMPAFKRLTPAQVTQIMGYVRGL